MWPGVSAMMNFRFGVAKYRYATSMVMPCSRSASSPSVSRERSISSWPRLREARATAASWSSKTARVSCSSRPIRVLLPSSTLPAVMKRRTPRSSTSCDRRSISPSSATLEIPFLLAPLHRDLGGPVVHARRAALGDRGDGGLGGDLGGGAGRGFDRAGAAHVADGAEAHRELLDLLAFARRRDLGHRDEQPASAHDVSPVRVVDR